MLDDAFNLLSKQLERDFGVGHRLELLDELANLLLNEESLTDEHLRNFNLRYPVGTGDGLDGTY